MTSQILVSILAFLSTTVYSLDLGTGDYRLEVPTLENAAECRHTIKDGKLDHWRNEMWKPEGVEKNVRRTTLRNLRYYYNGVKAVTAIDRTLKKYRFRTNLNQPVQFACKCGANILIENPDEFCYDWGGSAGAESSTSRFCIGPFKNELFRSGRLDNLQLVRQLYGDKQTLDGGYKCMKDGYWKRNLCRDGSFCGSNQKDVYTYLGSICDGTIEPDTPDVYYRMGSTYNRQENNREQFFRGVKEDDLQSTCRCGTNSCEWNTICQKSGTDYNCSQNWKTDNNLLPYVEQQCPDDNTLQNILNGEKLGYDVTCKCGVKPNGEYIQCSKAQYCIDGECKSLPKCKSNTAITSKCFCGGTECDGFCSDTNQCTPRCDVTKSSANTQRCYYDGDYYDVGKYFRTSRMDTNYRAFLARFNPQCHNKVSKLDIVENDICVRKVDETPLYVKAFDVNYTFCATGTQTVAEDCVYTSANGLTLCPSDSYFHSYRMECFASENSFLSLAASDKSEFVPQKVLLAGRVQDIFGFNVNFPLNSYVNVREIDEQATFNVQRTVFSQSIYDYLTYFNINYWGTTVDMKRVEQHDIVRLLANPLVHITNERCAHDHIWDDVVQACVPLHCPEGYSNQVFPSKVLNKEIMARSIIYAQSRGDNTDIYIRNGRIAIEIRTPEQYQADSLYKIDRMNRYFGVHVKDNQCHKCRTGYYCPNSHTSIKCPAGEYQDEEGQTKCKTCDEGGDSTYFLGEKCHYDTNPCRKGAFLHSDGETEACLWCPGGKTLGRFSFDNEKDDANLVYKGRRVIRASNACTTCPAGKYSPSISDILYSDFGSLERIEQEIDLINRNIKKTSKLNAEETLYYNQQHRIFLDKIKGQHPQCGCCFGNMCNIYGAVADGNFIKYRGVANRVEQDFPGVQKLGCYAGMLMQQCARQVQTAGAFNLFVKHYDEFTFHNGFQWYMEDELRAIVAKLGKKKFPTEMLKKQEDLMEKYKSTLEVHSNILEHVQGYEDDIQLAAAADDRLLNNASRNITTNWNNLPDVQNDIGYFKIECRDCPVGRFSTGEGTSLCEKCPAGLYSDSEGAAACKKCPQGRFTEPGDFFCAQCAIDQMNTADGSGSCEYCQPGKYAANLNTECRDCPAGYFKDRYEGMCVACTPGKHNPEIASISRDACLENPYILQKKGVSGYGYASYGLCPTGTLEQPWGHGNIYKCEPCRNGYTFPYGRVIVDQKATKQKGEHVHWQAPHNLRCETCPAGRGIQFSTKKAWKYNSRGKKRDFGTLTTRFDWQSRDDIGKSLPVIGRFCETCPPGKQNLGNSAFCTDCDYYEATELGKFVSIYSPNEPCGGAEGYGFLNSPIYTWPHVWKKAMPIMDGSSDKAHNDLVAYVKRNNDVDPALHRQNVHWIEVSDYEQNKNSRRIPAEMNIHPDADILRKTCYNSEGCQLLFDGIYHCRDPKPFGLFMGDSRNEKFVVPCDNLDQVAFVEIKSTWNSEKTYTMCEEGFVPDVSGQYCVPCRPQTHLGTYIVYGGWFDGLCLKFCPSKTTSTGAEGTFDDKNSSKYYECQRCNYPISVYGECQKPITCPDGLVGVKRWRGDWQGVCRSQCASNQYRDGYKNRRRGTMECFDCHTTDGFYADKTDRFLEARKCERAPSGHLVNSNGDGYIHEDNCPGGQIQGKQCIGHPVEMCAAGKYWDGSACTSPPSGKKTKRGAHKYNGEYFNVYDVCPAGTKTDGDACIECPYWQYQPIAGESTCLNCPGGTEYGPESGTGKTKCETCPEDTYSWDNAQEITFEKAQLIYGDIPDDDLFHTKLLIKPEQGYIWEDNITTCRDNIYCGGIVVKETWSRQGRSSSYPSVEIGGKHYYLYTPEAITPEMVELYPEMADAKHTSEVSDFNGFRYMSYGEKFSYEGKLWELYAKHPNRELSHHNEAHRSPVMLRNNFDSCRSSCDDDYSIVIANVSQGYPFVDEDSDDKYRECIEDRDTSYNWQREQADCTDVNSIPTGLWVPETTIYFTDYVFTKGGSPIQESVVVPAHCEKDKNDTTCEDGYMTIEEAVYDSIGRMIALPVCWELGNITKDNVFIYEDERKDSLQDISIVSNNVRCHPFDVLPTVTYVGTVHTQDDWTPRNDMTTFSRDIDILNTLDMVADDFDANDFEVTATCTVTKFYAHSDDGVLNGLDDSTYDDIICPGAIYKCDNTPTSSDGKDACENTNNTYIAGYWTQEEYTRSYFRFRTKQYETRTEFRNKYVPPICKNASDVTIATGGTQQDCEKTGKTFKVECQNGDRRLWHIENQQLKMVSTNLYIPPKCDDKYYVAEDDCSGNFTSAKCEDEDGTEVNMTSPAECVMGQYAHFCDHYGNNDIYWTWDTHSSPMSTFCRQFDNDRRATTWIYNPIIHVVMRPVHSHQMTFDVDVKPDDDDKDGIHDRDDNCPKTSTTPAFGFVSSEGCAYSQKSNEYKEYLYEEHCSHIPNTGNHVDCSVFTIGKQTTTTTTGATGAEAVSDAGTGTSSY